MPRARELLVSGELSACNNYQLDFSGLLDAGLKTLFHLGNIYENGAIHKKREIISSFYPEKLTFVGDDFRIPRVNEAVRHSGNE